MKQTLTPQQWFEKNVDMGQLTLSIVKSMADAIRNENIEEDVYVALVSDIISSGNGQYIPALALQYFDYEGINVDNMHDFNYEDVIWELDTFTDGVAKLINDKLDNSIDVAFGYWDVDGTYCLMAYLNKDDFETHRNEALSFMGDILEEVE